jgi:hypothetical protein
VLDQPKTPLLYQTITEKPAGRRNSFLNMFATKSKSKRFGAIRLSKFEDNISSAKDERTQLPLTINTSTSFSTATLTSSSPPPPPLRSPTTTPKSPRLNTIRRAFSANPNSTFYSVFDRNSKKRDVRRASIFNATAMDDNKKYLPTLDLFQDYVLRHAAVISIKSLVSLYSLDELLALLDENYSGNDNNSTNSGNRNSGLWGKLLVQMKMNVQLSSPTSPTLYNMSMYSSSSNSSKVFNVPIMNLVNREKRKKNKGASVHDPLTSISPSLSSCYSDNSMVPIFVKNCISALIQSGIYLLGLIVLYCY